jgi:hypothetical protein
MNERLGGETRAARALHADLDGDTIEQPSWHVVEPLVLAAMALPPGARFDCTEVDDGEC